MVHTDLIYWFSDVDKQDVGLVGEKGAAAGELTQAGFPIPNGFVISSRAYFNFIRENNLAIKIKNLLSTANFNHPESLSQVSQHIKKLILNAEQSDKFVKEVAGAYTALSGFLRESPVTISASTTATDLPTLAHFVQQETYTNIKGDANVLHKIKESWATLFDPHALAYRHEHNFDHFRIGSAIVIQQMIEADQSGLLFTIDPVANDKSKLIIEAIHGMYEGMSHGKISPDHYEVNKTDGQIMKKNVVRQGAYLKKVGNETKEIVLDAVIGSRQKISDSQIKELYRLGKNIEKERYFPQIIQWAIRKDKIYITQSHALTTLITEKSESKVKAGQKDILLTGTSAAAGIASGPARILHTKKDLDSVQTGEVLVVEQSDVSFLAAFKKANAIIAEKGGRMSHSAVMARELGIPAIVGAENATKLVKNGVVTTVNGSTGEVYGGGHITAGNAPIHYGNKANKTVTKVYVNLVDPTSAERISQKNVDGIGLLRAEPIIAKMGIHPKKMIREGKRKEFIFYLAEQIEIFCKAFAPRIILYRASDFTTGEYRALLGGKDFEPLEPNPLLGYRGAFRYIHDPEVFELELEAIKLVRNKHGFKNLSLMLPFVRTIRELIDVKQIISAAGLYRSPTFKLHMMVDTPSNVLLLDEFIQVGIDGISIDSDDLATLILGIDRSSSEVAHAFDEQNPAVLWALEKAIKTANKHKITSSICGQAPSVYPNVLEKLVKWGISSVSVPPNMIDPVRDHISQVEKKM